MQQVVKSIIATGDYIVGVSSLTGNIFSVFMFSFVFFFCVHCVAHWSLSDLSFSMQRDYPSFTGTNGRIVASVGKAVGQVNNPRGMCESTTTPGKIVVCDRWNNRIQEMPLDGSGAPYCRVLVQFTDGTKPYGITPCGDGTTDYIITDWGQQQRVLRISGVDGHPIWTVGSYGTGPQQFNDPYDVKMLLDGRVAVADCNNHRLQVLDAATGTFLQQLG